MPFYLSPVVNVIEKDFSLFIPAVSTSVGASVIDSQWGPIGESVIIGNTPDLELQYGLPTDRNAKDWFPVWNFLQYSNSVRVARVANISGPGQYTTAWSATRTTALGEILLPTNTTTKPFRFKAVALGGTAPYQTSGTEPTWPTALGSTVVDGDITWENVGPYNGRPTNAYAGTANETDEEVYKVVKNNEDWLNLAGTRETNMSASWLAKYPGLYGNRISVAYRDGRTYTPSDWATGAALSVGAYRIPTDEVTNPYRYRVSVAGTTATTAVFATTTAVTVGNFVTPTTPNGYRYKVVVAGTTAGTEPTWPTTGTSTFTSGSATFVLSGSSSLGAQPDWSQADSLGETITDGTVTWVNDGPWESTWENWNYKGLFQFKPESTAGERDEFAVVIFLDDVVAETFIVDAVNGRVDSNNQSNYAGYAIENFSKYVYFNDELVLNSFVSGTTNLYSQNFGDTPVDFAGGLDGDTPTADDYIQVWTSAFQDSEQVDISLPFVGGASGTVSKYVIENIATYRKDCVAFVSPHQSDVVSAINPTSNLVARRTGNATDNINVNSSYGFFDCNYKYQFDQYNDKYRWIPLNGDIAGLAAATDNIADPWWSFGGYNRGVIKNVTKLAWNPNKAQRDELYTYSINPVIMTKGEGAILYGDRTTLLRPSAFRAVNVRRLFIVLEKAIATSAKYLLFEFNDETTQAQFVSMVTPFLRDVQSRRGIQEDKPGRPGFLVVADSRINTPEVIDRQEFKALILIRPNRSINFIELTFAATKTGAIFEELVPKAVNEVNQ